MMVNRGDGWKDGRADGRTDEGTDGRTDGRTDVWKFPLCSTEHQPFGAAAQKGYTKIDILR